MRVSMPDSAGVKRKSERGMSLIELMIALSILATGLAGVTILLVTAIGTNNRNERDTTATLLAQKVIEQIASVNPAAPNNVTITDCAGNLWTISTADAAGPAGAGANLLQAGFGSGGIDQTQNYAAIPAGYAMQYLDCSAAGGTPVGYDVRWNIMTIRAGSTRLITASARIAATANQLGSPMFAIPVNLRTIGGTP